MRRRLSARLSLLTLSVISILLVLARPVTAEVTLDGTLGPAGSLDLVNSNYAITDDLGKRSGTNLFHSFGKFNIGTGESATFSNGGDPLSNVLARVTGGPSSIDGLIRSTIDGANLFLLNPAGVMFGPNASLDVPANFHVSTADYIKFSDDLHFSTRSLEGEVLSVASPESFGFLGSAPGSISIDQAVLQVPAGRTLSLVGGSLFAENDRYSPDYYGSSFYLLSAPNGTLNLISVASPGEVNLNQPDVSPFAQLGNIEFRNGANITVSDPYWYWPAGTIVIRGGNITFQDGGVPGYLASIEASGGPAGLIDVYGDVFHLDNASVGLFNTYYDNPANVARFVLNEDFLMTNGAFIESSSWWGNAGSIDITADRIKLGDDDPATSLYADYGFYGFLRSFSDSGSAGRGGDISLNAREITVQNGFPLYTASAADDGYYGPGYGDAGDIFIQADTLQILNKAQILSNAYGVGNGGTVEVVAREILISDRDHLNVVNNYQLAGIGANADYSTGGKILLNAENIRLEDGGQINSVLIGSGTGADVFIDATSLYVSGFVDTTDIPGGVKPYGLSAVDGRVFGPAATGDGGNILVSADQIHLENGGTIRTGLYNDAPGTAGDIAIIADDIEISSLGQVYADSYRGTGYSGNITIEAENLTITGTGNAAPPDPLDFNFTGLSTTTNTGAGGTITTTLTDHLILANGGGIKADTQGSGTGGAVIVSANNLALSGGGNINSSSTGTGHAGDIDITAADSLQLRNASITTEASVDADGGNIDLSVQDLLYLYYSEITSSVGGGPETTGGNINIDPEFVVLNESQIVANAFAGTGGNIKIVADTFLADPLSLVDASSQLGVSGTVDIQAPINNISGLVSPLSSEFISASALLKERCIARLKEGGQYSSFVVGGRDGLPIEPGGILPSTIF